MDFSLAFNLTVSQFGISAKDLAQRSGILESTISRFRNGHQIKTETLSRLLECLSVEQREYFLSALASGENTKNQRRSNIERWIETASIDELHHSLLLIGHKCVKQNSQNSQNFEVSQSVA
ncbi:hypothetical protein Cri9333_0519 [Crinalium epipsammum PCC 9333]|uniref:HTH cro/C1-type domain-containing protein n=1 Tax=Crinalium epipsammum PCC 9333 TaxID=1173022 RepID=K9VVE7_9CYAN|nr:helix-turn-helix transcriptional regulator [Crinalium epipsammum]AFZ11477.1 hypothetical protein Cri9333_0519 [Crinalium epipsammum PCC 9333]